MMLQIFDSKVDTLHYIVHDDAPPNNFAEDKEWYFYQFPFNVVLFKACSRVAFFKLKSYLIDIPIWSRIETFNVRKNIYSVFLAC